MLGMPVQIDRYQEMSALSTRMADAARRGDWDELLDLERRVASLRDRLAEPVAPMSDSIESMPELARMRGLIRQILDDDAEVRRHTEPWMEQVRLLLSGHLNNWQVTGGAAPAGSGAPDSSGS
jgi:flagellar protein FliT